MQHLLTEPVSPFYLLFWLCGLFYLFIFFHIPIPNTEYYEELKVTCSLKGHTYIAMLLFQHYISGVSWS